MSNDKFLIKNELLIQAICGGFYCPHSPLVNSEGYFNNDTNQIGRAFLEYCYSIIFNIHRFPGYEQGYLNGKYYNFVLKEDGLITDAKIQEACEELLELYNYTNHRLKKLHCEATTVTLYRSLRPFEINEIKHQLYMDNNNIFIPSNIISSYSYNLSLGYNSKVGIKREINIDDIVMVDDWVEYNIKNSICEFITYTGEYEIWVINKDIYGRIPIKTENLETIDNELSKPPRHSYQQEARHIISYTEDKSLLSSVAECGRPCEYNKITKAIIKRNMKKISKDKT